LGKIPRSTTTTINHRDSSVDNFTYIGLAAVLRRTAPYHEIRDDDLNGLVILVERRRSHLDQSLIWT
jgi:hypothetical protein